ncbi:MULTISPECIES: glycoside hydrolase family 38 C-terminal domain-containing protein [unclassified Enterococcus]|jgi:mannosylglycerate hydrolase|uniref:glycoside hydrolase family 38 N-terminal domain-containing protein n=1 Tax=unclassified Enterococcus TaxID=2608891 RepID=UPI003D26A3A4
MKKKVHVVNHTHWDREWYFTTMDAWMLSDNCFDEVIEELERNPEAHFCLDGQTSILDDYLNLNPDQLENIKKLVANKQLAIGPWYTQTDAFFVNEESFIRNLMIGVRDSKRYGQEMQIGYLPDTFGFNAQIPTILKNCGFDNLVFWRGINFKKHVSGPYFKWKGLGEKEIIAANLVDGYGTAAFLKDTPEYLEERLLPAVKKIESLTDSNELLIPAGGDQLDIIPDLPETLKSISEKTDYEFIPSSYEDFLSYLRTQENLPEYEGEFREPCTTRVHKSIGSVRYDIKRTNYLIEEMLIKRVEPLMAIANVHGIKISNELLISAWKKILEGHAHDSMGGCVSDAVADDILHRMKEAREIAEGIENYIVKRFSEKLDLSEKQVIVFNTTSKPFDGYKIIDFLTPTKNISLSNIEEAVILKEEYFQGKDNLLLETPEGPKYINEDPYYRLFVLAKVQIPSMGFVICDIDEKEAELEGLQENEMTNSITNDTYKITVDGDCLDLYKNEIKLTDFLQFEDIGNEGDTYDFSPLKNDQPILLRLKKHQIRKSSLVEEMILEGTFDLPKTLADRLKEEGALGNLGLRLSIQLQKKSDLIRCTLEVENQLLSHRLRVKLNTGIENNQSIASVPFGFIRRNALTEEITNWHQNYVEYPIDLEPYDKSVSMENKQYHFSAFGKGIKEYQVQNGSLYLTLFASTSQLGKPNLTYRPGRASGDTTKKGHVMMPTPKAELLGNMIFEFAFSISEGAFDEYETSKKWAEYSDTSICYQNQLLNKFIHRLDNKIQPAVTTKKQVRSYSLLSIETEGFDSSFSPSLYDKNCFVLRLSNPTGKELPIHTLQFEKFEKYSFINCREEAEKEMQFIAPYDIATIKLWYK